MIEGVVKHIGKNGHFGFIRTEGPEDLFFSMRRALTKDLRAGDVVQFSTEIKRGRLQAVKVEKRG